MADADVNPVEGLIEPLRKHTTYLEAEIAIIGHALTCLDRMARSLEMLSNPVIMINQIDNSHTLSNKQKEELLKAVGQLRRR